MKSGTSASFLRGLERSSVLGRRAIAQTDEPAQGRGSNAQRGHPPRATPQERYTGGSVATACRGVTRLSRGVLESASRATGARRRAAAAGLVAVLVGQPGAGTNATAR